MLWVHQNLGEQQIKICFHVPFSVVFIFLIIFEVEIKNYTVNITLWIVASINLDVVVTSLTSNLLQLLLSVGDSICYALVPKHTCSKAYIFNVNLCTLYMCCNLIINLIYILVLFWNLHRNFVLISGFILLLQQCSFLTLQHRLIMNFPSRFTENTALNVWNIHL